MDIALSRKLTGILQQVAQGTLGIMRIGRDSQCVIHFVLYGKTHRTGRLAWGCGMGDTRHLDRSVDDGSGRHHFRAFNNGTADL